MGPRVCSCMLFMLHIATYRLRGIRPARVEVPMFGTRGRCLSNRHSRADFATAILHFVASLSQTAHGVFHTGHYARLGSTTMRGSGKVPVRGTTPAKGANVFGRSHVRLTSLPPGQRCSHRLLRPNFSERGFTSCEHRRRRATAPRRRQST